MDPITSPAYQISPGLPVNIDVAAYAGDTWKQKFRLKQGNPPLPVDLTGSTVKSSIRNENAKETYDLTVSVEDQIDPDTKGVFVLSLTPDAVGVLPPPANYAWDVQTTDNADPPNITTWIAGRFFLERDVTV